ncbi:MAG: hypothetical protein KJO41_11465 [Bacteroidia bacterium]|nr:hypothetical protein [Bacteroidia bacterium]NND25315.1 hypothetical protein [Flavobacteriaceae bacterium]NNK59285.1 hypothetical protein [Flavobacteriaceae bacterium]
MKLNLIFAFCTFLFFSTISIAQETLSDDLPYYEIPDYPESYTACTVAARMIDGLGFRYYWATEGLRDVDLVYKPSEDGRTTAETIDHLYGLSKVIVNATLKKPNSGGDEAEMTFAEKRKKTLENFKTAADILRKSDDLSQFTLIFERGGNSSEFPFWNNINGPIEDAVWHCGQVVLLRRASGNPFNSKASVFMGKLRN